MMIVVPAGGLVLRQQDQRVPIWWQLYRPTDTRLRELLPPHQDRGGAVASVATPAAPRPVYAARGRRRLLILRRGAAY